MSMLLDPAASPAVPQPMNQQMNFGQRLRQNIGPILQGAGIGLAAGDLSVGARAMPALADRRRVQIMQQQAMAAEQQQRNATVAFFDQKDPEIATMLKQGMIDGTQALELWQRKQRIANAPRSDYIAAGAGRIFNQRTGTWVDAPGSATQSGSSSSDAPLTVQPPQQMAQTTAPKNTGITGRPLTEGQSKDVAYSTRARGALQILDPLADELADFSSATGGKMPIVGNFLKSNKYRQAEQAGREFLAPILRKDTGAAITQDEMVIYGETFLPQPGDDPMTLQMKKEARIRAVEAMEAGMPANAILAQEQALQRVGTGQGQAEPSSQGGVPEGVDPSLWEVMTPEERALWQ